jgi:HD superfamily phosphodiesterase
VTAEDLDVLEAAAWLHDIGYAPSVRLTGFHSLDGARYLREHGWPSRVCGLVAYHSGAHLVAEAKDLTSQLAEFEHEKSLVADLLTYADQTTGPSGESMTVDHRIADMLRRHGPGSVNALVHPARGPLLRSIVDGVEEALGERESGRL